MTSSVRRSGRSLLIASVGVTLAAVALPGAASGLPFTLHHVTTSVPVRGAPTRVIVDDNSGSVTVQAGGPHQVRRTESWNLIPPKVTQTERDGVLAITTRCPNSIPENDCGVNLVVSVPARVGSDLTAAVGDVAIDGMSGSVSVDAAVGDVTIDRGRSRRVTVTSAVGDIRAGLVRSPRTVRLGSPIGDIRLEVPPGGYAVTATSQLGTAKVNGIKDQASSRRTLTARSVVGDVHVVGVANQAG